MHASERVAVGGLALEVDERVAEVRVVDPASRSVEARRALGMVWSGVVVVVCD